MPKTTKNLNRDLKNYYREIGKALPDRKKKTAILSQIKNRVNEYIQQNPHADISDIVHKFGLPTEIAEQYFDDAVAQELAHRIKRNRIIGIAIICGLLLIIILLTCIAVAQSTSTVIYDVTSPAYVESMSIDH